MEDRGTDIKLPAASLSAGGLHVIGTERHDASRVDRQLIGRTARQGDPGSAQFFLSAGDALLAQHHPRLARLMQNSADEKGEVKLSVTSMLDRIQRKVERANFRLRRDLSQHDRYREDVLSRLHGSR